MHHRQCVPELSSAAPGIKHKNKSLQNQKLRHMTNPQLTRDTSTDYSNIAITQTGKWALPPLQLLRLAVRHLKRQLPPLPPCSASRHPRRRPTRSGRHPAPPPASRNHTIATCIGDVETRNLKSPPLQPQHATSQSHKPSMLQQLYVSASPKCWSPMRVTRTRLPALAFPDPLTPRAIANNLDPNLGISPTGAVAR